MHATESFSLSGKTAVVTGALGLIGKEHCRALASAGASIVVTDIDQAACSTFASSLTEAFGVSAIGIAADITEKADVRALKSIAIESFGVIDILVNNAAINDMVEDPLSVAELSKFEHYPLELWRRCLDVNVTGAFICSQLLGSHMAERGSGCIINIASTYGIVAPDQRLYRTPEGVQPFFKSPVYPTSKGAILSFTRFLAAYWGQRGVRVNAISPGGVENSQDDFFIENYAARTPLGRMAKTTDYHGALLFLASDASAYVTGANLVVDGGWTIW
jgi:NAD(P)-dependent dehydrogenase (short-subunit alcohol dehydrogenase family)